MKRKSLFAAAMAACMLVWTGCDKQVQSELDMET